MHSSIVSLFCQALKHCFHAKPGRGRGFDLTFIMVDGIISPHGEMSERFKEPVLKTGDGATHRGFESHSLRQKENHPVGVVFFLAQASSP